MQIDERRNYIPYSAKWFAAYMAEVPHAADRVFDKFTRYNKTETDLNICEQCFIARNTRDYQWDGRGLRHRLCAHCRKTLDEAQKVAVSSERRLIVCSRDLY